MTDQAICFSGDILPDREKRAVYVVDGLVTYEPVKGATSVASDVWLVPGLVDAHCHVGLGVDGREDRATQEAQALADRDAGALTLRDCGSPADTRWIDGRVDLPRILRAGRHIARPMRHTRGVGIEVEPADLVSAVESEVRRGDGWIKLVGDWIDRDIGDIAPLWPRRELAAAIRRAHELGARVTAHCFGEEALPDLIESDIDCIEHGTGLSPGVAQTMAERQIALVPTLINIARFPELADRGAAKFPKWAKHMRALHGSLHERMRAACEAGVPIFAGTDAGSEVVHGRITDEIRSLREVVGMSSQDALAAASWGARDWLGVPDGLSEGSEANFVVYPADPSDLTVLDAPSHIVVRGRLIPT